MSWLRLFGLIQLALLSQLAWANDVFFDSLPRTEVAPDLLVVEGRNELFDASNYGAIANSILIDSARGVLVIDTGSNTLFGDWLQRMAERHFNRPVVGVINTHGHPDHWFGNAAFDGVPKLATRQMIDYSRSAGSDLLNTLYATVGDAMIGTQLAVPDLTIGSTLQWGRYLFEVISLNGHSHGDAALFDTERGILIAGDLVFNGRSPTTPHADIATWIQVLTSLEARAPAVVIPGHGTVDRTTASIRETMRYLQWLDQYLRDAAQDAVDPAQLLAQGVPREWRHLAVVDTEFERSVIHLYSAYEAEYTKEVPR